MEKHSTVPGHTGHKRGGKAATEILTVHLTAEGDLAKNQEPFPVSAVQLRFLISTLQESWC